MYVLLRRNFQLEVKYYIRKEKQQFKNNDEVCCYDDIAACRIDGWRNVQIGLNTLLVISEN